MSADKIVAEVLCPYKGKSSDVFSLISLSRSGLNYSRYSKIFAHEELFTLTDWAKILNISTRTLERYRKEKKKLENPVSDRFLEVTNLMCRGIEVFGEWKTFKEWLHTENVVFGKQKPKDLLDTSFGIQLVRDELSRIEYGISA